MARAFFSPGRFADGNLKRGETFSVDSGLGGSFTVAFAGRFAGELIFERKRHGDWPPVCYRYKNEQDAAQHLFILTGN